MTRIIKSIGEWKNYRANFVGTQTLGFVPTLGGLHEGHLSLARRSLQENRRTAVSLFLNRVQFNNRADYEKYPADFEEDVAALEELGVDAVFAPSFEDMYPDGYRYRVTEGELSREMEGAHRPGHFDGVLTVVMRLLNIVGPTRAYFGEKDQQQLQLVQGMVEAFFMPVEIVPCPTVRNEDGLALSSRNRRLSAGGLKRAAKFAQILNTANSPEQARRELAEAGFEVDYVEERGGRRYGAVFLEGVRLIDNVAVEALAAVG